MMAEKDLEMLGQRSSLDVLTFARHETWQLALGRNAA